MTWLKALVSLDELPRIKEFLEENGRFVRKETMKSTWYDPKGSLAIEQHKGFSLVRKREGNEEVAEEVEIKCEEHDYDKLNDLFCALEHKACVEWNMTRFLYDWWPVLVHLEEYTGFGLVVEFKLYGQLKDKEKAIKDAQVQFGKLGIDIISAEDFDKKKQEFISKTTTS